MIKFLSEFGPLIAFFVGYKYGGIQGATLYMVITSVISVAICYLVYRKVQPFALVSSGLLITTGLITIFTGNAMFIKVKPTILYVIFGFVFLISAIRNKPFMKYLLSGTISLKEESWNVLSYRFTIFFFLMAIINEIVWRNFEEIIWVKFKVFGAVPITVVFILIHIPFVIKNKLPKE
jgi:intracellular septation protein